MNNLAFRSPSIAYRADACETGIGGVAHHGRGWRFELPQSLRGRAHINLLEFIASIVPIWVDIIEKRIPRHSCLLALTDNPSTAGWLKRSNFKEDHPEDPALSESDLDQNIKLTWARKIASLVSNNNCMLYSQ